MPTPPDDDFPPDPQKVLGQVIVDIGCMLVSVTLAAFVWVGVDELLQGVRLRIPVLPGLPLERAIPAVPALLVIAGGVRVRLWVRELFGVTDTTRDRISLLESVEPSPRLNRLPQPVECPRCAGIIPEGRRTCPACGWSDG